ncbi:MAG: hypothetical protein IPO99_09330 [Nitrospira sp.]|nr:hypothetical protein [Nitrospira sp.]
MTAPAPSSKPVGEWAKIGETDNYVYYADYASIKKADETVVMLDLFDYKSVQTEGGNAPLFPKPHNANTTAKTRKASRSSRAGFQDKWEPETSCAPPARRTNGPWPRRAPPPAGS